MPYRLLSKNIIALALSIVSALLTFITWLMYMEHFGGRPVTELTTEVFVSIPNVVASFIAVCAFVMAIYSLREQRTKTAVLARIIGGLVFLISLMSGIWAFLYF